MLAHLRIFSLFCFALISVLSRAQSGDVPVITAEGDQFYCPGSEINVVTDFNISGSQNFGLEAFYIQVSTGYEKGEDLLRLNNGSNDILGSWDPETGKLTLEKRDGLLNFQEINDAVNNVTFSSSNPDFTGEKLFSFTMHSSNFLPSTGHFYQYRSYPNISWTIAKGLAEQLEYNGLKGYLATITTREEAVLVGEQAEGTGWIGASDAEQEGTWKWVTGPEAGTNAEIFWIGDAGGYAPNGAYENWNTGEPNNLNNEDYGHVIANTQIGPKGSWNDLPNEGTEGLYAPQGYIVEYGYGGPEDAPDFSASTRVYTNGIAETVSGFRCGPGNVLLSAIATEFTDQPSPSEILWFSSQTSTTPIAKGSNYTTGNLISTTTYYVMASQDGCTDGLRSPVLAEIYEIPDIVKEVTLKNCDADDIPNDGFTDFNLDEASDVISKENPDLTISYHLTEESAISGTDPIDPPYFNNSIASKVIARAENQDTCFDIATVNLIASSTDPLDVLAILEACDTDDENDGRFSFDLTEATSVILGSLPDQDLQIMYFSSQEDALIKRNEILPQNAYTNEVPYEQFLFARIESLVNGDCLHIGEYVKLIVNPLPEFDLVPEAFYCENSPDNEVSINNPQGQYTYEWYDASGNFVSTGETLFLRSAGNYSVVATSALNCLSREKTVAVRSSAKAQISQEDIEVTDGGDMKSISINTSNLGTGNYEYALDNGPYQDDPYFEDVASGMRLLQVRDKNGCGTASIEVAVIGFPKFFTPNGDGYNDTWQVDGIISQPGSLIYIYDKFGKLLDKIDAVGQGWNGQYKGKLLPSSDYWFRVQLTDGRIYSGHFSLIRRE